MEADVCVKAIEKVRTVSVSELRNLKKDVNEWMNEFLPLIYGRWDGRPALYTLGHKCQVILSHSLMRRDSQSDDSMSLPNPISDRRLSNI